MKSICLYDSEQTMAGLIHHISVVPQNLGTISYSGPSLTVEIEEITRFYKHDPGVSRKIAKTRNTGTEYHVLPWNRAIPKILKFIVEHGATVFSHSWHNDLRFLHLTQEFISKRSSKSRIFHKNILAWPETGSYDANWSKISKVCSIHFLMNRCPKFMKAYTAWYSQRGDARFKVHMDLERLSQFVKGEKNYEEEHTSLQDSLDLAQVIRSAYTLDKFKIDGRSYYISEKSMEPSLFHNLEQKVVA